MRSKRLSAASTLARAFAAGCLSCCIACGRVGYEGLLGEDDASVDAFIFDGATMDGNAEDASVADGASADARADVDGASEGDGGSTDASGSIDAGTDAAPGATTTWSRAFGNSDVDTVDGVAFDAAGNLLLSGYARGAVDLGDGPRTTAGSADALVASYAEDGSLRWAHLFGGTGFDSGLAVTGSPSGDVVAAGYFRGTVDFGGGPLTSAGGSDIWVAAFSAAGAHLWSRRWGGPGLDEARDVIVDSAGAIYVTGLFEQTVDFGGTLYTSPGAEDFVLLALDATGAVRWARTAGDTGWDEARSVAAGSAGEVYVTGHFAGTVDFGDGPRTSLGDRDGVVASWTSSGALRWAHTFGGTMIDRGFAIAASADGPCATGVVYDAVDLGAGVTGAGTGTSDAFVLCLSTTGAVRWIRRFGGPDYDEGRGIAIDGGGLYVTGEGRGSPDFGGGAMSAAGSGDVFLAIYELADGSHRWSRLYGDGDSQQGKSVAARSSSVLLGGEFFGSITLPGGSWTSAGQRDGFVAHFPE